MDTIGKVKVTTTLGELLESDLEFALIEQESSENTWVVAREGRYVGNDPALDAHRGKIIRRDVWVTIKSGLEMTGAQGA